MKKLLCLAPLFALVSASTGCIIESDDDDGPDATLTVTNRSDFAIVELYVTQVDNDSWGPNLLSRDLLPDEQTTIGVACDTYDAKLIDESNVDCRVHDIDLCLNDADWVIRNDTCPVFGFAEKAREAIKASLKQNAAK